jgi:peroxiredoxin (alkyl hydroperoxide reductase subunit C)
MILIGFFIGIVALLLMCPPLSVDVTARKTPMTDMGKGLQAPALKINDRIPDLSADAYYNNSTVRINFSDYRGKWMVFIFYPADFTFVCPTELEEIASMYDNFTDLGAEVFSVSRDTVYVHKAWHDSDPRIKKVRFPMLSDTTGNLCRAFGTYNESDGLSQRASFIFDPNGNLKVMEIHDNGFGRNTKELLRELEAAKFVRENKGQVCPASWKPGEEAIQP